MKTTRISLELTDRQIVKLRELMDSVPLSGYADLIAPVLKALPLESDAHPHPVGPDADRQAPANQPLSGPVGGFRLTAFTPKGRAGLAGVEKLLATLPHVGSDL